MTAADVILWLAERPIFVLGVALIAYIVRQYFVTERAFSLPSQEYLSVHAEGEEPIRELTEYALDGWQVVSSSEHEIAPGEPLFSYLLMREVIVRKGGKQ